VEKIKGVDNIRIKIYPQQTADHYNYIFFIFLYKRKKRVGP